MNFKTNPKTIVVATDLNGRADGALAYARKLALAFGARVVLAHSLDPMEYAAVDSVSGELRQGLSEEARTVLDGLSADLIRNGIHSHSEVRQGAVTQTLVDVAVQYDADLILVGTKGGKGVGPVVVGSVAEQLVRQAPCPVLAVAADWSAGGNRPTPGGGAVMLAMERNEATESAVASAAALAETLERPLVLVHARDLAGPATPKPCITVLEDFDALKKIRDRVQCIVKDGKPEAAIPVAIEELRPSLLVIGAKRTSGTPGPHGTAFQLMARSKVPVMCVPPQGASRGVKREASVRVEVE
ncbi:MAG TPA: universal stress protein [Terracidiphilus sp.]|nr:universal stress protein [Terracidiphilus sp.]